MDALPPVPTPAAQRWREVRIQFVPVILFFLVLIGIAFAWRSYVQPAGIVGEVEAVTNRVTSVYDGQLIDLRVDRFEPVTNGQVLGLVAVKDPLLHQAMLDQAAADLRLMKLRMDLDRTRNLDAFTSRRVELLAEQQNVAMAKTRLVQAEGEFARAEKLLQDKVISSGASAQRNDYGYDVALRDRDLARTEVAQLTAKAAQLEQDLAELKEKGAVQIPSVDPVIEDTIKAQQEVMRQLDKPVLLFATSDGVVREIFRRPGEKVLRGEPILAISTSSPDRLVAFIRQPIAKVTTASDTAVIYTRATRHHVATARILRVGTQLEPINPLLLSPDARRLEVGLPILLALPSSARLLPGEFVDVSIRYAKP